MKMFDEMAGTLLVWNTLFYTCAPGLHHVDVDDGKVKSIGENFLYRAA